MRTRWMNFALVCAMAASFLVRPAVAAEPIRDFDTLLQRIAEDRKTYGSLDSKREQDFLARRESQQALLDQAIRDRDAAKVHSDDLSSLFDANELKIVEEEDQLKIRLGSLGELEGVVQQVSSDAFSVVYNSLVSAQYPGREAFFTELSSNPGLPTVDQLARIAESILTEAAESGQVRRFEGHVVNPDGVEVAQEVIRVGPFMAVSEGQFLSYSPALAKLTALPRQPGGEVMETALAFAESTEGYQPMPLDPSRGVLLDLYVQRPNTMERIEKGEEVGYVILAVGAAGAIAAIYQVFYLIRVRRLVTRQLKQIERPKLDNPLGRVLASYKAEGTDPEEDSEVVELRVS